ncbi:MAG: hypothetical protein JWN82_112 [Candidatus Saccharibacteria bacterium]|nr:hypothetical protein [Candidatus Saccharibacteria bacterium]
MDTGDTELEGSTVRAGLGPVRTADDSADTRIAVGADGGEADRRSVVVGDCAVNQRAGTDSDLLGRSTGHVRPVLDLRRALVDRHSDCRGQVDVRERRGNVVGARGEAVQVERGAGLRTDRTGERLARRGHRERVGLVVRVADRAADDTSLTLLDAPVGGRRQAGAVVLVDVDDHTHRTDSLGASRGSSRGPCLGGCPGLNLGLGPGDSLSGRVPRSVLGDPLVGEVTVALALRGRVAIAPVDDVRLVLVGVRESDVDRGSNLDADPAVNRDLGHGTGLDIEPDDLRVRHLLVRRHEQVVAGRARRTTTDLLPVVGVAADSLWRLQLADMTRNRVVVANQDIVRPVGVDARTPLTLRAVDLGLGLALCYGVGVRGTRSLRGALGRGLSEGRTHHGSRDDDVTVGVGTGVAGRGGCAGCRVRGGRDSERANHGQGSRQGENPESVLGDHGGVLLGRRVGTCLATSRSRVATIDLPEKSTTPRLYVNV